MAISQAHEELNFIAAPAVLVLHAWQVCDQVLSEAPTDEQVLNILAMVYKSKAHQAKLTSAYEAAIKARPNDANLLVVLLSQYTRCVRYTMEWDCRCACMHSQRI